MPPSPLSSQHIVITSKRSHLSAAVGGRMADAGGGGAGLRDAAFLFHTVSCEEASVFP